MARPKRIMAWCAAYHSSGGKTSMTRFSISNGVGRKTANVVLSVGFGIPAFAVDTHVSRICKHHQICKQDATPLETEAGSGTAS